jgi:isorenieratene synthase
VIGAGVAGLSAALHLAERGLAPWVFEADPRFCGGRLAGGDEVVVNGWRFRSEHGVHGIWSPYRNLHAMLARHAIRPVMVPAQEEGWIYQRDLETKSAPVGRAIRESWLPAPFHYLNLFGQPRFRAILGWADWMSPLLVFYGLLWALAFDPFREGELLAGLWLKDLVRFWPPVVGAFFVGLARNGLAARPEEVPLSGFIAFLRFYTLRRRDAWAFSYLPADGGASVVEPLAERVCALGGKISLGRRVTRLERIAAGWQVAWQTADGATSGVEAAKDVILAVDARNAAAILKASFTGPETADLYWPRSMETAVARFWFTRPPRSGPEGGIFTGEFVIDNYFWLHRLQDAYRRWHQATGGSALEVHFYGPSEVFLIPDAVLLAYARKDVLSAFPELKGCLLHETFQRNPATHTLFEVGPAGRHLGIQTPWPDLYCCGDWVSHPSPAFFLERACVTGIAAANAVLAAREQPAFPLLDYLPAEPLAGAMERGLRWARRRLRRGGRPRRKTGDQRAAHSLTERIATHQPDGVHLAAQCTCGARLEGRGKDESTAIEALWGKFQEHLKQY